MVIKDGRQGRGQNVLRGRNSFCLEQWAGGFSIGVFSLAWLDARSKSPGDSDEPGAAGTLSNIE